MRTRMIRIWQFLAAAALVAVSCRVFQAPQVATPEIAATQIEAPTPTDRQPTDEPVQDTAATQSAESPPEVEEAGAMDQAGALRESYQSVLRDLPGLPHYEIDLRIDYAGLSFTGETRIDYTNLEDRPLDQLYLRLLPNGGKSYGNGSLSVTSVEVDGESVDYALSGSDTVLLLPLDTPVDVRGALVIDIQFEGRVPENFGGSQTPSGYGIYNFSDNVLALSGWYPILAVYDEEGWNLDPVSAIGDSVYSDMAYYTVVVQLDADLVLASTGDELQRTVDGDLAEVRLISGPARDFFLIMSPDYEVTSREVDGVAVNSYYLPGHGKGGEAALEITSESLRIYNRRFGEYPYTELDVVDGPMRNALGVEYPAIFMVASQLYEDPSDPSFIIATAHEVAHQWWYNVVGNDVFEEPWLDEALTTYSSGVYSQEAIGQEWYQGLVDFWEARYDQLLAEGEDDLVTGSLEYYEDPERRASYGGVVYTKGALFFKDLREEIGDQAFFTALQSYYQNYQFEIATGQDMLGAFEAAAGKQLDDFYNQWLFTAQ